MIIRYLLVICSATIFMACKKQSSFEIHHKPIRFDSTRAQLSLKYLSDRYGMKQDHPTISPRIIVLHWTAIPTFEKSYNFFYESRLNPKRKDIEDESNLNVAAHYLIKRNGKIYQLLPDTLFARHVIGLNHAAIGIENVGARDSRLTEAQLRANTYLVRMLTEKYNIEYLIGHYEYTMFEGHRMWKELDDDYRTEKIDPGRTFMKEVRSRISDLKLKGPPDQSPFD